MPLYRIEPGKPVVQIKLAQFSKERYLQAVLSKLYTYWHSRYSK